MKKKPFLDHLIQYPSVTLQSLIDLNKEGELNTFLKDDVGYEDKNLRTRVGTILRKHLENLPKAPIVVVTGANGYIACHTIEQLLRKGYRVRGTVRSLDPKKTQSLRKIQEKVGGELQLFEADLLKEASFADAIRDADYVLHMASPFIATVKDPKKELLDPAVNGTLAILNACAFNPTVKRVVLTSSMAAVTDSPEGVLTEDVWNVKSSLKRNPYYYSKAEAERAAWKFMKEHKLNFDLVTILPFIVWGPALSSGPSESLNLFTNMLNGVFPVIMSLDFGIVDVRDVALAHILAIETPQASGRYVCFDNKITMRELIQLIRQVLPDPTYAAKLPTTHADCSGGDALLKLFANFQESGVRDYLQKTVGKSLQWDASKIKRDLGINFKPIQETVKDTVNFLIATGQVGVAKK